MIFSKHAETRKRQRGFSNSTVDTILKKGTSSCVPGGAIKVFLTKKDYQKIVNQIKNELKLLEKAKNGKIIMKDNIIITVYK